MRKRRSLAPILAALSITALFAHADVADRGLLGIWKEPGGGMIQVESCGPALCLKLVGLPRDAPSTVDGLNPDESLRTRALCGLEIGQGFQRKDGQHADGGSLYDPKSGRTYKGTIASEGNTLKLRGYVGIKAFGRSETWMRSSGEARTCRKS